MNKTKIIIILIVVLILGITFYFTTINPNKNTNGIANQDVNNNNQKAFNFYDNKSQTQYDSSVISDQSTTTATFNGYYILSKNIYGEENVGPADCDSFVIFKNNNPLFQFLAKWSPGSLNINGDLLLHISFYQIPDDIKNKITHSTKENPVALTVQKIKFEAKGLPLCASVLKIISAE